MLAGPCLACAARAGPTLMALERLSRACGPHRVPAADAHDLPTPALQCLGDGAVEESTIGGRHLEAESVVVRWDDAAADLYRGGTNEIGEQSAGVVSHGPGDSHDAYSKGARCSLQSSPTPPEPRLSVPVMRCSAGLVWPMCRKPHKPCCSGRYRRLKGCWLAGAPYKIPRCVDQGAGGDVSPAGMAPPARLAAELAVLASIPATLLSGGPG